MCLDCLRLQLNRLVLCRVLDRLGFHAVECCTGVEALQAFIRHGNQIACILMVRDRSASAQPMNPFAHSPWTNWRRNVFKRFWRQALELWLLWSCLTFPYILQLLCRISTCLKWMAWRQPSSFVRRRREMLGSKRAQQ